MDQNQKYYLKHQVINLFTTESKVSNLEKSFKFKSFFSNIDDYLKYM